jgi:hypothetical protein
MTTQSSLQIDLADRAADSDLECCIFFLSTTARRWLQTCKSRDPNKITMIGYVNQKGDPIKYICYASDARKLSRAIGIAYSTFEVCDYKIPVLSLEKTELGMYADQLSRTPIELILI